MTAAPAPLAFHRRLAGYAPTALLDLDPAEFSARRVAVKLETHRFGLPSFKVLGASWAVARRVTAWLGPPPGPPRDMATIREALDRRRSRPTLLAATDGNHGRAVVWAARQIGAPSEVFVPAGTADARVRAIAAEGAIVHLVEGDYDATVEAAAADSGRDRLLVQDTAVAGHETGVDSVVEGYRTIFDELDAQLGERRAGEVLLLVVPVGVGSLAVAAARALHRLGDAGRLVTVEPTEAASLKRSIEEGRLVAMPGPHTSCMVGLRCGSISAEAWPELREATELAVSIEDAEADAAMRWLAERGIVVGECGAAALAALRRLEADGSLAARLGDRPATVALIATEAPTDPGRWRAVVGREPD